ncbi:hypothetical protein PENTCL1PPCAC_3564, partial [Pristionchus entomophagus]
NAVCFISKQEIIPRKGLRLIQSDSLSHCKLSCIRDSACQSITFNSTLKLCVIHGDPIGQVCSNIAPYTRLIKTLDGCPQATPDDVIANYVTDPCLQSAILTPASTYTCQNGICPLSAVEGEASPRAYVVSVIRHDGTHDAFGNNIINRLQWNATLNSYVVYLFYGGSLLINEPVYAAMCAYYPTDVAPECDCPPLPLQSPGTAAAGVAPAPMCSGQARAQKWIVFPPMANGAQNSWIIASASCL